MKLQSVMSSARRFLWLSPWTQYIGVKGSLATTRPSKIVLNMDRRAVKANPMANMDFILTIVRSRLVFFSFSSSASIFLFLSMLPSPCASFFLFQLLRHFFNLYFQFLVL